MSVWSLQGVYLYLSSSVCSFYFFELTLIYGIVEIFLLILLLNAWASRTRIKRRGFIEAGAEGVATGGTSASPHHSGNSSNGSGRAGADPRRHAVERGTVSREEGDRGSPLVDDSKSSGTTPTGRAGGRQKRHHSRQHSSLLLPVLKPSLQ